MYTPPLCLEMRRTLKFNEFSREITTSKDGYVVEKPIVVQPCNLGSPLILTTEVGSKVVMVVMPTKISYRNLKLAITRERKNRYNDNKLPDFIAHMIWKIMKTAGNTGHAKQQQYGYS
jgi:hypothetical protein